MPDEKKLFAANWKMYLGASEATALAVVARENAPVEIDVVLCPDFTAIHEVNDVLEGTSLFLGAQDCAVEDAGAYTGEVSAKALKDRGCAYVIVGHSERRVAGETDEQVAGKVVAALRNRLAPILCVGESAETREAGKHEACVEAQLRSALVGVQGAVAGALVVAYEPVWAIAAHKASDDVMITNADIVAMAKKIRAILADTWGGAGASVKIIYGGSVNASNVAELASLEGVGGVLVGSASANAEELRKMLVCLS